jgi:hypothetical protein
MTKTRNTINERMDILQNWMESNYHLTRPEVVTEHIETIAKFWSVLSEEDREYIQCAQHAIEEKTEWLL